MKIYTTCILWVFGLSQRVFLPHRLIWGISFYRLTHLMIAIGLYLLSIKCQSKKETKTFCHHFSVFSFILNKSTLSQRIFALGNVNITSLICWGTVVDYSLVLSLDFIFYVSFKFQYVSILYIGSILSFSFQ